MANVRQKNVIIARRIGETPLSSENFHRLKNARRRTPIHAKSPTTRDIISMSQNPVRSTFGGPRSSSAERVGSEKVVLF